LSPRAGCLTLDNGEAPASSGDDLFAHVAEEHSVPNKRTSIFLSAVSDQFRDCRKALASDLRATGAEVVLQEDFAQHPRTLLEKLQKYIAECDRVIALVGDAYGFEPEAAARPPGRPRRSYTQWEYAFAMGERLKGRAAPRKDVFVYLASEDYLRTHLISQGPEEAGLQRSFVRAIRDSGEDRNPFDSLDGLCRLALRDGFALRGLGADADRNLLYGVLALQGDFIDKDQFVSACAVWATKKDKPLIDILVEHGWITPDDRRQLEAFFERMVMKRYGGNVRASLAAVADAQVRDALRQVDDTEVHNSVNALPPAAGQILIETFPDRADGHKRYERKHVHAEGGLGRIWLARDNDLNREVALKELKPDQATHADARRRFLREAQVTGQLEHPNIVPIYELVRRPGEGQPFYTMPFLPDGNLGERIADHHAKHALDQAGRVELRKLLHACVGVCLAVDYAHSRGVIHRDLKPENIVLGDFGEVLVLDWGLAKAIGKSDNDLENWYAIGVSEDARPERTQQGALLGTPAYMAPEQAQRRTDSIDERTDVYGLGAILFELLTGRPPHQGDDTDQVVAQVASGPSPRARDVASAVPAALDAICAKAMAKDRSQRYATAQELAKDLGRWLDDVEVSAAPDLPIQKLARWGRRHPTIVHAAASALVVSMVVSTVFVLALSRAWNNEIAVRKRAEQAEGEAKTQKENTELANRQLRGQARKLSDQARELGRRAAMLLLDRGLAECEAGRANRGLLWMARAFEGAPKGDTALTNVIGANLLSWAQTTPVLEQQLPHDGSVIAVALSVDGKSALTACDDGAAQVWDVSNGQPITSPMKHGGAIEAVAFSPDGKLVLTGSDDRTARLWDARTGEPRGFTMTHEYAVLAVGFSPAGNLALTASFGGTARLWDARTGRPMLKPAKDGDAHVAIAMRHKDSILTAAFSPDSQSVLTGSRDQTARLWDARTGEPIGEVMVHKHSVVAVAFNPNGKSVVTCSEDGTARLWDAHSGQPIGSPMLHKGPVVAAAFSPNGQVVLTGSYDRTARLWNSNDGAPIGEPMPHRERVRAVAFAPDGGCVLTGGDDHAARLWGVGTGEPAGSPLEHRDSVVAVAFTPDGQSVLTASRDRTARLWSIAVSKPTDRTADREDDAPVPSGSDRQPIVTDRDEGRIQSWDPSTGSTVDGTAEGMLEVAAFSPHRRVLLTIIDDRTCQLWNVQTRKPIGVKPIEHESRIAAITTEHTDPALAPAFSRDGETFLTRIDYLKAQLWNARTGQPIGKPMAHRKSVLAMAFSPDGRFVITGSFDRTARLWDAVTGEPKGEPLEHKGSVDAVAFSPDGQVVLTGGRDGTVRFWDVATGRPIGPGLSHRPAVSTVAFATNGKELTIVGPRQSARKLELPRRLPHVEPRRLQHALQAMTGLQLDDGGAVLDLDLESWKRCLEDSPPQRIFAPVAHDVTPERSRR
jgi:WD40 repeat protein